MADAGFDVELKGLEFVIEDMSQLPRKLQEGIAEELYRQLSGVLQEAKDLAPYEFGALSDSGRISEPEITVNGIKIVLDFGVEPHLPYAIIQHEALEFDHPGGKEAKYLEKPLLEWTKRGPIAAARAAADNIT